jgi:plasmid stability protein
VATINVHQLDEEVVRRLKLRAARNNRSLESEVLGILERASEDAMSAKRQSFRELSASLRQRT